MMCIFEHQLRISLALIASILCNLCTFRTAITSSYKIGILAQTGFASIPSKSWTLLKLEKRAKSRLRLGNLETSVSETVLTDVYIAEH